MRGIVWIELRRSILTLCVVVLAIAQVGLMLNDVAAWRGVWPMATAAVSAPWLFLGPVAAGMSAFDALRRARLRRGEGVVDGLAWRSESMAMLVSRVFLVCLVLLVGAVCAVVVNLAAGAPTGFLWPSYLVVACAFAVECVVLGMLLGSLGGPLWFAPLLAVLVTFLRGAWFQGAGMGSSESSFTRIFLAGRPWVELNTYAVICAVVEAAVVVALALTVPEIIARARVRRSGRVYPRGPLAVMSSVAAGVALIAGAGVAVASPSILLDRQSPDDPVCSQTQLKVCVWPENELFLPPLAEVAVRAQEVADSVGGTLMDQINEFGVAPGDSFVALGQGTWFFSDTLSGAIAYSLAPIQCDPPADDPGSEVYFRALHEVSALLQLQIEDSAQPAGYGSSSGVDMVEITKIWRATPSESQAWIQDRVTTMETVVQTWCE